MTWCPSARKLLQSSAEHETLAFAYSKVRFTETVQIIAVSRIQLNESSDGARGDDCAGLKRSVAEWLMECTPAPNPVIHKQDKTGRGFYNDVTGRLLCPVDYDWSDPT
jgi:hypothetical protein